MMVTSGKYGLHLQRDFSQSAKYISHNASGERVKCYSSAPADPSPSGQTVLHEGRSIAVKMCSIKQRFLK
ncbi:hypothetical protein K439DRAFT_1089249 [Ramaria rubella]|nr:hypothetical protein K439DRAFT_1089249 [Ramaria rubella]